MLTLSKQQIGHWVLLDYLSQKQSLEEKITMLENKYQIPLDSFEKQTETATSDNFEAWDDLIEWKAYTQFLSEINSKIADVRNGDFQMAG